MITLAHGNLLEADVDALVNPVNTVGVMGKGIAFQFERAYPQMFASYVRAAKDNSLELGLMHVWPTGMITGPRFVINFPTEGHWRAPSRVADIERGLDDLVRVIRERGIRSVALPPGLRQRRVEVVRRGACDPPQARGRARRRCAAVRPREPPRLGPCRTPSPSLR